MARSALNLPITGATSPDLKHRLTTPDKVIAARFVNDLSITLPESDLVLQATAE